MPTTTYFGGYYNYSDFNQAFYNSNRKDIDNKIMGFSYNGIHCEQLGVYYIPKDTARGDFFSPFEVVQSENSWFPGGKYFISRVKSRVFSLDCYYEEIDYKTREKIIRWLDRRTQGPLIFDNRPYAEYYVHPTKTPTVKDYRQGDFYSGLITIEFTAYDPFAKLTCETLDEDETGRAAMETSILPGNILPPSVQPNSINTLIYNPGTETGHSIIRFKGSTGSSDFSIYNAANKTRCTLKAGLNTGNNTVQIDSKTGRVLKIDSNQVETTYFEFHDDGYISFVPNEIFYKDITIETTAGSRMISLGESVTEEVIGKWIRVGDSWVQINEVSNGGMTIQINTECATTGTQTTYITSMNYLQITKATDAAITSLEIICKPEVR